MPEKVYGSNLFMIGLFAFVLWAVFSVFNFIIFNSFLSTFLFILLFSLITIFIFYVSIVKKVFLYKDEIVFRKVLKSEVVPYDMIHQIAIDETLAQFRDAAYHNKSSIRGNYNDTIDYFVLYDKNGNTLMRIYTGLIGNVDKQIEFINTVTSKNKNIILEQKEAVD